MREIAIVSAIPKETIKNFIEFTHNTHQSNPLFLPSNRTMREINDRSSAGNTVRASVCVSVGGVLHQKEQQQQQRTNDCGAE